MLGKRKSYIWFDEPGNWYEADDTGARIAKKNKIFWVMKYSDDTTEEVRIALRKHACEGGGVWVEGHTQQQSPPAFSGCTGWFRKGWP